VSVIEKIADTLGEKDKEPFTAIERLVNLIGEEKALALLEETLQLEAGGGMTTDDGSQRRTPGGVFFKLAKNRLNSRERWLIFGSAQQKTKQVKQPITWEESQEISCEALQLPKGEASIVKITVIGRPERVIEKQEVVITSLKNSAPPSLPKGLPVPPTDPTIYVVYIAIKQWRKVKASLDEHPDDKLIVEGYPRFDKRIGQQGAMTIYAQNVTTKLLQQAQRQKQRPSGNS
jgi:hypothetical protein